jgi:hypothetical protein
MTCVDLRSSGFRLTVCFVASAALLLATGCGPADDGLNRQPIWGKVTSDDKPVPIGSISFEPLVAGGVGSGAVISKGEYSIPAETGLPPGKYRVTMSGNDGDGFPVSPGSMPGDDIMPPKTQLIPPKWKEEVEVKAGESNVFDFAVKAPVAKDAKAPLKKK